MLKSMTGYGSAKQEVAGYVVEAEVRSVNHRYLKINVRGPEALLRFQSALEAAGKEQLSRGSVEVTLRLQRAGANGEYTVQARVVESYCRELQQLQQRLGLAGPLDLAVLLSLPGAVESATAIEDEGLRQQLADAALRAVQRALGALAEMRATEGRALQQTFLSLLEELDSLAARVEARRPAMLVEYQVRLRQRIQELLGEAELKVRDEDLIRELAIYAERSDIAEEILRLRSHNAQFREACQREESMGRRIEFITQEMHREVNTMGAKANDTEIASLVVEMKGIVDRLKEQAMNIE